VRADRGGGATTHETTRPRLSIGVLPHHASCDVRVRCARALDAACASVPGCERIVVEEDGPDGMAAALASARGEVVWLLRDDAEIAPDAATRLLAAFDANPWLGVAGAEIRAPDGTPRWCGGTEPGLRLVALAGLVIAALLGRVPGRRRLEKAAAGSGIEVDWVSGTALALRRAVWLRVAPLDPGFRVTGHAADLCLRARGLGWQVMIVPGVRVTRHDRGAIAEPIERTRPWADLARLAVEHRGVAFARHARRALLTGTVVRLAVRRGVLPLVGVERREAWRRDTAALAADVDALRRLDAAPVEHAAT
jgi:hypothetical protein